MGVPSISPMPDSLKNPTAPQRDFGEFTFKFFNDIFSNLQISPDGGVSNIVAGQIIMTGAVQKLPENMLRTGLTLKAFKTNAAGIYLGASSAVTTANGFPLFSGDAISFGLSNSGVVYFIGTANDVLAYAGN